VSAMAGRDTKQEFVRRIAMEWEKPEIVEISLACEISSYANAELAVLTVDTPRGSGSSAAG